MPEMEPPVWVIKPHIARRTTQWYITWEDLPDNWAILVISEHSLHIPGTRSVTWDKTQVVFPEDTDVVRNVDFQFASKKNGAIACFDTMAAATSYIARQRKNQCSKA